MRRLQKKTTLHLRYEKKLRIQIEKCSGRGAAFNGTSQRSRKFREERAEAPRSRRKEHSSKSRRWAFLSISGILTWIKIDVSREQIPSEINNFDKSQLKKMETIEKVLLPNTEGEFTQNNWSKDFFKKSPERKSHRKSRASNQKRSTTSKSRKKSFQLRWAESERYFH